MKKNILILFVFLSLSMEVFSYVPSLDSLLRNGNNLEIGNNTIVANFLVTRISTQDDSDSEEQVVNIKTKKDAQALKLLIFNEREDYPKLVQMLHEDKKVERKTLYDIKVAPFHTLKSFARNEEKFEQKFFYSLMSMLLRNDSRLIVELLKEQGVDVKENKYLVNKDKLKLLNEYKYYLKSMKNTTSVANDLKNPLRPVDLEERTKVNEILKQPFLKEDNFVKRNKSGDYFNWIVERDRAFISFDNTHRLEEISLKTNLGNYKAIIGRFLLQGSAGMEFPEIITIEAPDDIKYEIKLTKLSLIPDNSKAYYKRLERYKKSIQDNNLNPEPKLTEILL